jgi:hypothetical protein
MSRAARIAALALVVAAAPAAAWPVNARIEVRLGEESFQRLTPDAWLEVEKPQVAEAELLETSEVMITGKAEGSTLVLVHAEGKVMVWRVVVRGAKAAARDEGAAPSKVCAGAKVEAGQLTASIRDEACRKALLKLLSSDGDAFLAKDLDLTFDVPMLQAQLRDIEAGIARAGAKVQAAYLGAGLRLKGEATQAQYRKLYWEVFRNSVGRLAIEDRIEIAEEKSL